ncbi:MAG: TRAP transporter permease, partial [Synergistaceae bacterium]|nr:TRAP transporter permease [Synergistaceae bacterium]
YAGSAIAKAPPMKTAFNATKLAIGAFIVPYIFAFTPAMLFENVQPIVEIANAGPMLTNVLVGLEIVLICATALLGIFGVAASLNGYLFCPMNIIMRVIICAGGLSMLVPGIVSDLVGLMLVGFVFTVQYMKGRASPAV